MGKPRVKPGSPPPEAPAEPDGAGTDAWDRLDDAVGESGENRPDAGDRADAARRRSDLGWRSQKWVGSAARTGALDLLLSWIQTPDVTGLAAVGRALPWFFAAVAQKQGQSGQRADLARTCVDILDGHELAADGVPVWTWRDDTGSPSLPANTGPTASVANPRA